MLGLAVPAVGNWVGWPVWKHRSVGQLSCLTRESLLGTSAVGEEGDEKWMKPLCWIKPEMLFGEKNVPGLNSKSFHSRLYTRRKSARRELFPYFKLLQKSLQLPHSADKASTLCEAVDVEFQCPLWEWRWITGWVVDALRMYNQSLVCSRMRSCL